MKNINKKQEKFLDECTIGTWKLNQKTGLVDVDGYFNCFRMGLSDFRGIEFGNINLDFDCSNNKLVSLKGAPQKVGLDFLCYNNQLVSLEGAPQKVGGTFSCANNQLVSLEGAPIEVMKNFYCYNNKLVSLEGISNIILGNLYCDPVNIRNRPIYKFAVDIYFYINGNFTELKKYIEKFINNLAPEIYLKKYD